MIKLSRENLDGLISELGRELAGSYQRGPEQHILYEEDEYEIKIGYFFVVTGVLFIPNMSFAEKSMCKKET